jgi:hypothetical protein
LNAPAVAPSRLASEPTPTLATSAAAGLDAWLAMLQTLGQAAWIVDAHTLSLAAVNDAAMRLLGWGGVHTPPDAPAAVATPEDLAFWADVKAGHHGALDSHAVCIGAGGALLHVARRISP